MKKEKGAIYAAKGDFYIQEALQSARSLKNNSNLDITLICDKNIKSKWIDDVRNINNDKNSLDDTISDDLAPYLSPEKSPYKKTMFLDSDTYVCEDISNVFYILENFDIGLAHNPGSRIEQKEDKIITKSIPNAFPRYNGGVILFKDNTKVRNFFERWKTLYEDYQHITTANQPTLRKAMYESNVRIATLPSEYNLRIKYNGSVGFMSDTVKIVHGRHPAGLNHVKNKLNKHDGMRVYSMKRWPLEISTSGPSIRYIILSILLEDYQSYTFKGRFINSIKNNGIQDTIKRLIQNLSR